MLEMSNHKRHIRISKRLEIMQGLPEGKQVSKANEFELIIKQMEFLKHEVPKDRFVTYEPSDLEWMVYFGIAKKRFTPTHIILGDDAAYLIDMNKYKMDPFVTDAFGAIPLPASNEFSRGDERIIVRYDPLMPTFGLKF